MIGETKQAEMTPVARVIFLAVQDQRAVAARRVGGRPEVSDVRNALLLVDDEVVDNVEVLGPRLPCQVLRRVPIMPSVVHVDVQVRASEDSEGGRQFVRL